MLHFLRVFLFFITLFTGALCAKEPSALYLTWLRDPLHTMTIQWHTPKGEEESVIFYQKEGDSEWKELSGGAKELSGSDLLVHTTELTDLEPGTTYQFSLGEEPEIYRFRTLPERLTRPLRFAVGGDAYFYLALFRKMNRQIAKMDPDFVVVGGDIAYTEGHSTLFNGDAWRIRRWQTFFKEWKEQMVTTDGRLIPLVPVVGNHDVHQSHDKQMENPVLFYDLFAFPEDKRAFRSLDFGSYLSLTLLDTGHTWPIEGVQSQWLENTLAAQEAKYRFAVYHVAAYPSHYSYNGKVPTKLRNLWVPLFEKYGVQIAFEHHNHAYKRTKLIREGKESRKDGILYLGDGSWGVPPRTYHDPKETWYLAEAACTSSFFLVFLEERRCYIEARNNEGKVFDYTEVWAK